ncbi:MAG: DUF1592 domain-containing protein [Myxococcota bacterium]
MRNSALLVLALALLGCDGLIAEPLNGTLDTPTRPAGAALVCEDPGPNAPVTTARLLDGTQYENALRELLGTPGLSLSLDERMGELVTPLGAERLFAEVERATQASLLGDCTDDVCAEAVLGDLARRAFRRPPTPEEQALALDVFRASRDRGESVREATELGAEVLLQAPQTLYLLEAPNPELHRLSGYEVAARLALLLWNGIPDEALLQAAEAGRLDDTAGVRAEAERMLGDDRARAAVRGFFERWLGLDGSDHHSSLDDAPKDPERYPEADAALRVSMRDALGRFLERVLFDGDGTVEALFTARDAYVDDALAALYGVSAPPGGGWVELPEEERAGLLTRAAFLAVYASSTVRSPIRRGVFVLEEVLCRPLGSPPPNANDVAVEGGVTAEGVRSIREDVTARTRGAECAGCHDQINPVGFVFGRYDALGRFQTEELHEVEGESFRFPIDPSSVVAAGTDADGAVDDALALSARLGASLDVQDCLAERFYEHAMARALAPEDGCSVVHAKTELRRSGRFLDLVLAVATSDAFLYARSPEAE